MSIALCNSFQCLIPQSEVLAVLTFSGSNRNSLLHTPEVHRCQIEPRKNSSVYENIVFIHVCKRKWSSMSGKGHPALVKLEFTAMSTFSPVGSLSSNCMRMCVCVCVCVDGMNLKYVLRWHIHISVLSVLCQCYTHKRTHTCILKSFEDSKPTGLKVDTADQSHSQFFCTIVTCIIKSYTHSSS